MFFFSNSLSCLCVLGDILFIIMHLFIRNKTWFYVILSIVRLYRCLECLLKAFHSALIRHVTRDATNGSGFNTHSYILIGPKKQKVADAWTVDGGGGSIRGQKTNTFDMHCFYGAYQSYVLEHVSRWFTVCAIITFKSN